MISRIWDAQGRWLGQLLLNPEYLVGRGSVLGWRCRVLGWSCFISPIINSAIKSAIN